MVQVQTKLYDAPKMSEDKRAKATPGGRTPKPELQTVRFEWPGQPVGPGSDVLYYKPKQRRPGELPRSVHTGPAIWLPSPQGGPWWYNGLNEETLASATPTAAPVVWYSTIIACSGLILAFFVVIAYIDQFRLLSRCTLLLRRNKKQNTVKLICQIGDEKTAQKLPKKSNDSNNDMPPSYSKIDLKHDAANEAKLNDLFTPYACLFTSGKNQVPRILFYDTSKDKEVMEKMNLKSIKEPKAKEQLNFNVTSYSDFNDPSKKMGNFLIEINDSVNDSGCIIGMKVLVPNEDAVIFENDDIPVNLTIEHLDQKDSKKNKKSSGDGKK